MGVLNRLNQEGKPDKLTDIVLKEPAKKTEGLELVMENEENFVEEVEERPERITV